MYLYLDTNQYNIELKYKVLAVNRVLWKRVNYISSAYIRHLIGFEFKKTGSAAELRKSGRSLIKKKLNTLGLRLSPCFIPSVTGKKL